MKKKLLIYIFIFCILGENIPYCLENNNEDFNIFQQKFFKIQEFQIERTIFPLEYYRFDVMNLKKVTYILTKIDKNDWIFNSLNIDSKKYEVKITKKTENEILLLNSGTGSGLYIEYYFKLIDKKWYLYKVKDNSN